MNLIQEQYIAMQRDLEDLQEDIAWLEMNLNQTRDMLESSRLEQEWEKTNAAVMELRRRIAVLKEEV